MEETEKYEKFKEMLKKALKENLSIMAEREGGNNGIRIALFFDDEYIDGRTVYLRSELDY